MPLESGLTSLFNKKPVSSTAYTSEATYFPTTREDVTRVLLPEADHFTFNPIYKGDKAETYSAADVFGSMPWATGSQNFLYTPSMPDQQETGGGGEYYFPSISSGGGASQADIEWILGDYDVGGQGPSWWKPFTVKNKDHFSNPAVSATLMMNALIGSGALSDEDARSMAKQLYVTWGGQTADNPWDLYSTKFGDDEAPPASAMGRGVPGTSTPGGGWGGPISMEDREVPAAAMSAMMGTLGGDAPLLDPLTGPISTEERGISSDPTRMQASFDPFISEHQAAIGQTGPGIIGGEKFSRDRSEQVLNALSMMREATVGGNVHEFGPGYQYLQEIAGALGEAGTADTRAKRQQILGALDPMLAMSQGGGELAGFGQMAQALASPFYTNLPPEVSRTQAGDYQFGRQSKHLFF